MFSEQFCENSAVSKLTPAMETNKFQISCFNLVYDSCIFQLPMALFPPRIKSSQGMITAYHHAR